MPRKPQPPTPTHGGARPGAGRRRRENDAMVNFVIRVAPAVRHALRAVGAERVRRALNDLIRCSK